MWIAGRRSMGSNEIGPVRPHRSRENRPDQEDSTMSWWMQRAQAICPNEPIWHQARSGRLVIGPRGSGGSGPAPANRAS